MNQSYVDKFNILQTLENNMNQKILMGSIKDHPEELVIINILHNMKNIRTNMGKFKKAFKNLKHIEKLDESLVVVTKTQGGIPLDAYLEEETLNVESRLSMIFQYLKSIKRYDGLDHGIKSTLMNESQIVVQKGKLALNELLMVDGIFTNIDSFQEVTNKVGKVVRKILSYPIADENVAPNILEFVEEIEKGQRAYKNLEEIYNTFKDIYLYGERKENTKSNKIMWSKILPKFTIGMFLAGIGILGYMNFIHPGFAGREAANQPTAYFEKIKMKNQWQFINKSKGEGIEKSVWEVRQGNEIINKYNMKDLVMDFKEPGEYNIVLKVQNEKNQWSEEYIEKVKIIKPQQNKKIEENMHIPSDEKLENLNIIYENENNITKDYGLFRNGEYAIKFTNMKEKQNNISIKDINLDKSTFMSMWVMSDAAEAVQMKIEAYKNGKIQSVKTVNYKPSKINTWELMRMDKDLGQADEVKIIIMNQTSTVWLDDIEFAVYK